MYELCTICLEINRLIVTKQFKLTKLIKRHNFGTWRNCCFLTPEYLSYQHKIIAYVDGDNVEVYVDSFLTIVNDFQPLVVNRECSVLDFASVLDPSLKTLVLLFFVQHVYLNILTSPANGFIETLYYLRPNLLKKITDIFIKRTDNTTLNKISLDNIIYSFLKTELKTRFPLQN